MTEEIVSFDEIAELLAGEGNAPLSRTAIGNFVQEGMPKAARGQYPARACTRWYIARLRRAVHQRKTEAPDGTIGTLDDAQIRLTTAKAENEEMTAKERRGELVPLWLYAQELSKVVVTVRAAFVNLPARIAPRLEGLTRVECKALLAGAVREQLLSLARSAEQATQKTPAVPDKRKRAPRSRR